MTQPISIAKLRRELKITETAPGLIVTRHELLSLLDAVEAADTWRVLVEAGRRPGGSLASVERWVADMAAAAQNLIDALARFDFGDQP